jgi:hypothetical protein
MSKSKSMVHPIILDRSEKIGTWDQAIAESRLAIERLKDSIKFFEKQKSGGVAYPGASSSTRA